MNRRGLIELLLELRKIKPELDSEKVLSEGTGCLTKYPFLGPHNSGMFRTSRYTLFSSFGLTNTRKAIDYFYGDYSQEMDYEKITRAFIAQYLYVMNLEDSSSLTFFLGSFLKNPDVVSFSLEGIGSDGFDISIRFGEEEQYKCRLGAEGLSDILALYGSLNGSISNRLSKYVFEDVAPRAGTKRSPKSFLKTVTLYETHSQTPVRLIDDVVIELSKAEEVQCVVHAIHNATQLMAASITKQYVENPSPANIVHICKKKLIHGPGASSFIQLVINLFVFMYLTRLHYTYYVPSVSSTGQEGDVGYTFFVASLRQELENLQREGLALIASSVGSLAALIEQYRVAEDAKWRQIGLRTLHQIKTEIRVAAKKIDDYLRKPDELLLQDSAHILERVQKRAERSVLFEKKKFGAATAKYIEIPSLRGEVEKILEILLSSSSSNSKIHPTNSAVFYESLDNESYKQWVRVIGTEVPIMIEESFELGLPELLLNCLEHTHEQITIDIDYTDPHHISLVTINTEPMVAKLMDYINDYPNREIVNIDIGFGLPMILETLEYCDVKYSVQFSTSGGTVGTLLIPYPGVAT